MSRVDLKRETIHGVRVNFEVDDDGKFHASAIGEDGHNEQEESGPTLADAVEKITKALKAQQDAARKPVKVTLVHFGLTKGHYGGESYGAGGRAMGMATQAVLRGVNGRTGALLVTIAGKKLQLESRELRDHVLREFAPDDLVAFERLYADTLAADKALEDWLAARRIDPKHAWKTDGGK